MFLVVGWGVPMLSFLELLLNFFFQTEIIFYNRYLIVIASVWLIACLVSLILLFKKRLKFYIFLILMMSNFGLFYHWVLKHQFSFEKNIEGTDYMMKIFAHRYEVWQTNRVYRQRVLVKISDIFHDSYSKIGIAHLSKVRIFSNDEEKKLFEIQVKAKREVFYVEKR
ncbi:hypothetical protein CGC58_07670 [Capnocytophaga stomatis]|uniref:Uncharacterized protein n=1 Tax=Capnocytophaga stomatis TaxID=1848904 RepID=A0A250FWW5_9FLAO|nr:hypothetical protein CGC58_07670 [Capnocytophaga stomatis]